MLPLSPQLGDCSQVVRSRPASMTDILHELNDFLKENKEAPVSLFCFFYMAILVSNY